jgi:hypothetical protein
MTTDVTDGSSRSGRGLRWVLVEYGPLAVAVGFALLALAGVALFLVGDESLARQFLDKYGLLALFAILVLEGAMLLYFAPSEALVPATTRPLSRSSSSPRRAQPSVSTRCSRSPSAPAATGSWTGRGSA